MLTSKWPGVSSASFLTPVHILRTWNKQAPKECACAVITMDKNVMSGSLVMSSIKYSLTRMHCAFIRVTEKESHKTFAEGHKHLIYKMISTQTWLLL
jgi:hypothetical protein